MTNEELIGVLDGGNIEGTIESEEINGTLDYGTIDYDKNYVHRQSVASEVWNIQHNLNKYPSVSVIDSSNREVFGNVEYIDLNNVRITFSGAFSGKATLN